MGFRKMEQYHRMISWLKIMMGMNLILAVTVIILVIGTIGLKKQVNQLTSELEASATQESTEGDNDEPAGQESDTEDVNQATAAEPSETDFSEGNESATQTMGAEKRNYIVCIDAGHGGPQGKGAISTLDGRIESHDTLKLALAVRDALESYEDITVVMTRDADVGVDNGVRAEIANNAKADLFVSFHRNSNVGGGKNGIEGWIHSSNPDDSRAAGELILEAMEKVGVAGNFGVKSGTWDEPGANYKIIRLAQMPAVLLEVGYLNSAIDNQLYDVNVEGYATATAEAIYTWLEEWVER